MEATRREESEAVYWRVLTDEGEGEGSEKRRKEAWSELESGTAERDNVVTAVRGRMKGAVVGKERG